MPARWRTAEQPRYRPFRPTSALQPPVAFQPSTQAGERPGWSGSDRPGKSVQSRRSRSQKFRGRGLLRARRRSHGSPWRPRCWQGWRTVEQPRYRPFRPTGAVQPRVAFQLPPSRRAAWLEWKRSSGKSVQPGRSRSQASAAAGSCELAAGVTIAAAAGNAGKLAHGRATAPQSRQKRSVPRRGMPAEVARQPGARGRGLHLRAGRNAQSNRATEPSRPNWRRSASGSFQTSTEQARGLAGVEAIVREVSSAGAEPIAKLPRPRAPASSPESQCRGTDDRRGGRGCRQAGAQPSHRATHGPLAPYSRG